MNAIGFICACGRVVYDLEATTCARCASRPAPAPIDFMEWAFRIGMAICGATVIACLWYICRMPLEAMR